MTKDESTFPYFVKYASHTRTKLKLNPQSNKLESVSYNTGTGGYIDHILLSREEAIVHVIAHELRHLWQVKIKSGYRVWGARGQFSDRDAYAFAIRKTREWRRRYGNQIAQGQEIAKFPYDQARHLFSLQSQGDDQISYGSK